MRGARAGGPCGLPHLTRQASPPAVRLCEEEGLSPEPDTPPAPPGTAMRNQCWATPSSTAVYSRLQPSTARSRSPAPEPSGCSRGRSELLICPRRPSNLVRILAARTQPDHLKRFFALFGTRSSFRKNPVPALARKTHFLVQNFSNFKILTKYDGYRHPPRTLAACMHHARRHHKLGVEEFSQASWDPQRMRE